MKIAFNLGFYNACYHIVFFGPPRYNKMKMMMIEAKLRPFMKFFFVECWEPKKNTFSLLLLLLLHLSILHFGCLSVT